ncbi:MAG: SelL-related redox protein [Coraliomargarita sp.]
MKTLIAEQQNEDAYKHAVKEVTSTNGWDIESLSTEKPLLLVFLRHLNCIYCRESLAELGQLRNQIEDAGSNIGVVHMGEDSQAEQLLALFGLDGIERFADPERRLYTAFGLERTTLGQLMGPASWLSMVRSGIRNQFLPGKRLKGIVGDILQMPGVFLLNEGRIVGDFRPEHAHEHPEYLEIAALEC